MTSKTFKCVEHEEEVLEVYPFTGEEGGRKFSLLMPHVSSNAGIAFDSATAPALALAILEAAGLTVAKDDFKEGSIEDLLIDAALHLKGAIRLQERATAEAEAQAKLEAEALELLNASNEAIGISPHSSTDFIGEIVMRRWLAVARKAREMRAEK